MLWRIVLHVALGSNAVEPWTFGASIQRKTCLSYAVKARTGSTSSFPNKQKHKFHPFLLGLKKKKKVRGEMMKVQRLRSSRPVKNWEAEFEHAAFSGLVGGEFSLLTNFDTWNRVSYFSWSEGSKPSLLSLRFPFHHCTKKLLMRLITDCAFTNYDYAELRWITEFWFMGFLFLFFLFWVYGFIVTSRFMLFWDQSSFHTLSNFFNWIF